MQLVFAPPDPPLTDLQGTRKCLVRPHDAPKGCLAHAKSLCGIIDVQNLKFSHFTIPIRKTQWPSHGIMRAQKEYGTATSCVLGANMPQAFKRVTMQTVGLALAEIPLSPRGWGLGLPVSKPIGGARAGDKGWRQQSARLGLAGFPEGAGAGLPARTRRRRRYRHLEGARGWRSHDHQTNPERDSKRGTKGHLEPIWNQNRQFAS